MSPFVEEFRELARYRDLVKHLIARNIKTRYKRSALGILWTMLNPLLMMLVLTFVFSEIFRNSIVSKSYSAYALAGLLLWNFFAQTTTGAMSELIWGGGLLKRIYLPRAIFAVSALGTSLVNLLLSLIPLFHNNSRHRGPDSRGGAGFAGLDNPDGDVRARGRAYFCRGSPPIFTM